MNQQTYSVEWKDKFDNHRVTTVTARSNSHAEERLKNLFSEDFKSIIHTELWKNA